MNEKDKLLRGKILDFLRYVLRNSDGEVEEMAIIHVFYQYHKIKEIREALHYLVSKGYIASREVSKPTNYLEKIKLYKITATGIDVLDGTLKDLGIIIPEAQ